MSAAAKQRAYRARRRQGAGDESEGGSPSPGPAREDESETVAETDTLDQSPADSGDTIPTSEVETLRQQNAALTERLANAKALFTEVSDILNGALREVGRHDCAAVRALVAMHALGKPKAQPE